MRPLSRLKAKLGVAMPPWVVNVYRRLAIANEFIGDYCQYCRATTWHRGEPNGQDRKEFLQSRLTLAYHGLEKGASFPNPKRPYGQSRVPEIKTLLTLASSAGIDAEKLSLANSAVAALEHYNSTGEISDEVTPKSSWRETAFDDEAIRSFVTSRHSVRNYREDSPVDTDLIRTIAAEAAMTPSVCNRRSYRLHYFDDAGEVQAILALQNGNRGFGQTIPGLFVVTERRSSFVGAGERNQRWIDGGLFAMSLVWLCHAHGLGTCFLNWSQTNRRTSQLRKVCGISRVEDVITCIAVGHPAPGHRVARSPLRPESDTFIHHGRSAAHQRP